VDRGNDKVLDKASFQKLPTDAESDEDTPMQLHD